MEDPTNDKAAWRTRLRRARRERPRADATGATGHGDLDGPGPGLLADILALAVGPGPIAAFHPTVLEPDLLPLLRALASEREVLMPVSGGPELEWARYDPGTDLVPSPVRGFGDEPGTARLGRDALATVDLVLAPALAVDRSGTRLGHGRGFYDRALRHRRPGVLTLAVVHPDEVLPAGTLPHGAHDLPVDGAVTTQGLERFRVSAAREHAPSPGPAILTPDP
jgi:5-formyltetrahydrofolate cyclo-ligase